MIKYDLNLNNEKYEEICRSRSEAGKKGAQAKKAKEASEANEAKEAKEANEASAEFAKQNKQNEAKEAKQADMICNDMICYDVICSDNDNDMLYSTAEAAEYNNVRAHEAPAAEKNSGVFELYEKLIGKLTPRVREVFDSYKLPDELKIHAVNTAHDNNARSLKYIDSVLKGYVQDGVASVSDAERKTAEYKMRRTSSNNRASPKVSNYDFDEIERLEMKRRFDINKSKNTTDSFANPPHF
jgi:DnaD/phage-associated family protein